MGTPGLGIDNDDAASALFSIYFHCERDVVAQALDSDKRLDVNVARDVLPSRFQILSMPIAIETLKASAPHPEVVKFAVAIMTRALPDSHDDLNATPMGVHILDLVEFLPAQPGALGSPGRRLSPQLSQEFKSILGQIPNNGSVQSRITRAHMALWGKDLGKLQLQIGSYVTRKFG